MVWGPGELRAYIFSVSSSILESFLSLWEARDRHQTLKSFFWAFVSRSDQVTISLMMESGQVQKWTKPVLGGKKGLGRRKTLHSRTPRTQGPSAAFYPGVLDFFFFFFF